MFRSQDVYLVSSAVVPTTHMEFTNTRTPAEYDRRYYAMSRCCRWTSQESGLQPQLCVCRGTSQGWPRTFRSSGCCSRRSRWKMDPFYTSRRPRCATWGARAFLMIMVVLVRALSNFCDLTVGDDHLYQLCKVVGK